MEPDEKCVYYVKKTKRCMFGNISVITRNLGLFWFPASRQKSLKCLGYLLYNLLIHPSIPSGEECSTSSSNNVPSLTVNCNFQNAVIKLKDNVSIDTMKQTKWVVSPASSNVIGSQFFIQSSVALRAYLAFLSHSDEFPRSCDTVSVCVRSRDPNNHVATWKTWKRSSSASWRTEEGHRFGRSFSLFFLAQPFDTKKSHKSTFPT